MHCNLKRETMTWIETAAGHAKVFTARAEGADFGEITPSLVEWVELLFKQLQGLPAEYEWNRVSMEVWLDSGRLIAYPALEPVIDFGILPV
jgi:hypothetical protein